LQQVYTLGQNQLGQSLWIFFVLPEAVLVRLDALTLVCKVEVQGLEADLILGRKYQQQFYLQPNQSLWELRESAERQRTK
jgi:hypothetical protein